MAATTPDDLRKLRRTVRLTLRITPETQELINLEHVEMICPPGPENPPELGVHSGHWIVLEDDDGEALFTRLVDSRAFGSAEIFSPDGTIRHVVGQVPEAIVEVLLPDLPEGTQATLIGQPMDVEGVGQRAARHSRRLATFDLRHGSSRPGGGS